MSIRYFTSAPAFRAWLETHHASATELWVGFYKKGSGMGGLTYAEAVDEALCFGWIDGLKKRVDELSYKHRFTPRQPRSTWSRINLGHVARLIAAGRMAPAGLRAYEARDPDRAGLYSFENKPRALPPAEEARFKADRDAWTFFAGQPPGYRKTALWWVMSAKKEETRARRLAQLIADSHRGQRVGAVAGGKQA